MEDRNEVLQRQPAAGNASFAPCPPECEAWSTPVLIGLNAAAGTDAGIPDTAVEGIYSTPSA
jgi:hypothetical protein